MGNNTELDPVESAPSSSPPSGRGDVSFVAATPSATKVPPNVDQGHIIAQYAGTMSLTPLSDFTMHRDRTPGLEASYIVENRRLVTGDGSKPVLSQTLRDLVERLAEVEPFEPYWEDIEDIDLHDKRLTSLHKLDEFMPSLTTLDVSGNHLRNLVGVPSSLRHLKLMNNQLSELTSWAHLTNLQYLDLSNNKVNTLAGLSKLVHLRSLKANNCGLTCLDRLKDHDGIQSLQARGNLIEALDFRGEAPPPPRPAARPGI